MPYLLLNRTGKYPCEEELDKSKVMTFCDNVRPTRKCRKITEWSLDQQSMKFQDAK